LRIAGLSQTYCPLGWVTEPAGAVRLLLAAPPMTPKNSAASGDSATSDTNLDKARSFRQLPLRCAIN
jgi:hypothetical protein